MRSIGESVEREDPTNNLLDVQTQLEWLRAIGFEDEQNLTTRGEAQALGRVIRELSGRLRSRDWA